MPVDTRLDGDPGQLYAAARWLRNELGFEVHASASTLRSAGSDAVENWQGAAGTTFHGRMSGAAAKADALHGEIEAAAGAITRYADQLAAAQGRMAQAREIAAANGLTVSGQTIMDPGPAPAGGGAADYARQVQAYNLAQAEAQGARAEMAAGNEMARGAQNAARARPLLQQNDVLHGGAAPPEAAKPAEAGVSGGAVAAGAAKPAEAGVSGGAVAGSASKPAEDTGSTPEAGRGELSERSGGAPKETPDQVERSGGAPKEESDQLNGQSGGAMKPAEGGGEARLAER